MKIHRKISFLALIVALTMLLQSVAFATPTAQEEDDIDQYLVSVETIPGSLAKDILPPELLNMLAGTSPEDNIAVCGTTEPDRQTQRYDLGANGAYYFDIQTRDDTIYSNYVFVGHEGRVSIHLDEYCTISSGNYTFSLYKVGALWNTEIRTYEFPHDCQKTLYITCDAEDLLFFEIVPNNQKTWLSHNSYIKKL